jgi:hypothetical protein
MPPTRKLAPDLADEVMLCWRLAGRTEISSAELETALRMRGILLGRQAVRRTLTAYGWRRSGRGRWSTTPPR